MGETTRRRKRRQRVERATNCLFGAFLKIVVENRLSPIEARMILANALRTCLERDLADEAYAADPSAATAAEHRW